VAAITAVFTTGHVVRMLDEDADWLQPLSIDMDPRTVGCMSTASVMTASPLSPASAFEYL